MDITLILSQSAQNATETNVLAATTISKTSASANSSSGDTLTISEEGKALAATMSGTSQAYTAETKDSEESESSSTSSTLETLKKAIEQLEHEIEEIEDSEMTEEEKEKRLGSLRTALAQAQLEYAQALQEESGTVGSTLLSALGSEAQGFANSLT